MASITVSLSPMQVARIDEALQKLDAADKAQGRPEAYTQIPETSLEHFNLQGLTQSFKDAAQEVHPSIEWNNSSIVHGFCV